MLDQFNRRINYLRVSVTDRCNLRCRYCMPAEGVTHMSHDDILRFNEIVDLVKEAVNLGVDKVRITGGEPLVRKGLVDLIHMLAEIPQIKDLGMTTNAILLEEYAKEVKEAGLNRVNISLDTMNPDKYRQITRGGNIEKVFRGIDAAESAGLIPIKLNCVISESVNEPDAIEVGAFAKMRGFSVRYIHEMDLDKGTFRPVIGGEGGNCKSCNRLRLTSNGLIKPCLFSTNGYSVRDMGAREALIKAIKNKPFCGGVNPEGSFYGIGG